MNKHYKTLQLDKVLLLLSQMTSLNETKEAALNIEPSVNFKDVKKSIEETEAAYLLSLKFAVPNFGNAVNISSALKRADVGAVLSMRELLDVSENLRVIRSLCIWRENCDKTNETLLDKYFSSLSPNQFLEDKINSAIKSEDEIFDRASPTLFDIRRKIALKENKIREALNKTVRGPLSKYLQDNVITQRDGRFVVPVKLEYKSNIKGIVHDTSSSGQTLFIEPMSVVEANNDIRVLKNKESEEISKILSELSASVSEFSDSIRISRKSLVALDLVFAKAKMGFDMKATVPILNNEGKINLIAARHPLIDKEKVVPIDINLGYDFNSLIITGPNTGGKTVAIKTVGLLTAMAECGLMIPANDKSEIAVFDNIFADIGDEQSIEQSLSTFSSHMVNIISILNECDNNSLVLLDELCAGTDPVEGAALAKSILIDFSAIGAKSLVTTHYPELKIYALDTPYVQNASCEFDVKTLMPTYRLVIGSPGRSNAFAISKRLGLDERILDNAKSAVSEDEQRFENAVSKLESARHFAKKREKEAESLKTQLKKEKEIIKTALDQAEKDKKSIMDDTRKKATDIIENARYKADNLLNELEEIKKSLNVENAAYMLQKARKAYKSTINEIEEISDPIEEVNTGERLETSPQIADVVFVASLSKEATVLSVDEKNKRANVMVGALKLWVPFDDLRIKKHVQMAKNKTRTVSGMLSKRDKLFNSSLDIRGMASDEGIIELDKFIDDAVLSGVQSVTIIHGKGTGVLRKAVHSYLRSHKSVKSFRVGTFGEGENGVTIAEIKE